MFALIHLLFHEENNQEQDSDTLLQPPERGNFRRAPGTAPPSCDVVVDVL
jgi:hypothetical protein